MTTDRTWLFALAAAAMLFFLPWTGDPYYAPRLALVAMICVPLLLKTSYRASIITAEVLFGLLFWVISAWHSQDVSYTVVGSYAASFDCLTAVTVYAAVMIGVGRLNVTAEDAADAILTASIPLSAYAIVQRWFLARDPFLSTGLPGLTRVVATQGWPVYLGAVLAIVAACAVGTFRRRPVLASLAVILALPAIGFTGTRGALLATAAAVIVAIPWRASRWVLLLSPLAYLARAGALRSDTNRVESYKIAWKMFTVYPMYGTGPGTYSTISRQFLTDSFIQANHSSMIASQHAHNQILQVLAATGIVGLIGYSIVIAGCWRVARRSPARALLITVAVAYAVVASLNPIPLSVTVMMAMLFGAASSQREVAHDRLTPLALSLMCLVSFSIAGRIVLADFYLRDAVRVVSTPDRLRLTRDVDFASMLNPWELRITSNKVDMALSKGDAATAIEIAHQGVLMHVNDSSAHEIYGRAVLIGSQRGRYDAREALMAFDMAQELAPTFKPLMLRRRSLAMGLGMAHEAVVANADLIRIQNLEAN